jgi:hypothetical protein
MIKDISCDPDYMLQAMPLIGIVTREKMPWVPKDETIYLFMDNAGGHGMEEAIGQYRRWIQREFNIEIIFQAARAPEVNVLDSGFGCQFRAGSRSNTSTRQQLLMHWLLQSKKHGSTYL